MHILKTVQKFPVSIEEAWDFFSDPRNLKEITPKYMGFEILSGADERMYAGQMIKYLVRPILGIGMEWVTEITHVREPYFFVDEQRSGPYRLWHHQHIFKPIDGGIEMQDIVHYDVGLGWIGNLANAIFVRKKLKEIFDYRYEVLEKKFGKL